MEHASNLLVMTGALCSIGRDEPVVVCITGSGLKTVEALENRVAEPLRVGASLSAVESLLPDLQSITTR